jgi:hypothetical protein
MIVSDLLLCFAQVRGKNFGPDGARVLIGSTGEQSWH